MAGAGQCPLHAHPRDHAAPLLSADTGLRPDSVLIPSALSPDAHVCVLSISDTTSRPLSYLGDCPFRPFSVFFIP